MRSFLKLSGESILFGWNSLVVNKLRTFLSLLGVTIGIFAIIAVFTMVDSMERNLKDSIASLGENVIFVQKWPWTFGPDYPWWKYIKRPVPTLDEMEYIDEHCEAAAASALLLNFNRTVEYENSAVENVVIIAASHDFDRVREFELSDGRYFMETESATGKNVAIIGSDIVVGLFGNISPLGRKIKIKGRSLDVVGVFKREGESMLGNSTDTQVLIPITYARTIVKTKHHRRMEPRMMVKAKPDLSNAQLKDELTGIMRSLRKLSPKEVNDFALNETSLLSNRVDKLIFFVSFAGKLIAGFSILVGGFGIANIMFVSVKERTSLIGIQKSLGAKKYFILLQFLAEAVMLCLVGGITGLALIYIGTLAIAEMFDMVVVLTIANILWGICISAMIGLVSGIVPAWSASRLDPVEAIRAN